MVIFFCFLSAFFLWSVNILGLTSWSLNILFVIVWVFTILSCIKSKNTESALNIIMIYCMSVGVICCLIVEGGAYLSEIRMFGKLSGATIRVGFTALIFLLTTILITGILSKYLQPVNTMDKKINWSINILIQIIMFGSFLGLLFVYSKYGTPNSNGVDRFKYWSEIAPGWGRYLQFMLLQFSFLLGIKYTESKAKKYIVLLVISVSMQFIGGEKFTGPSLSILFFLIPILFYLQKDLISVISRPKIMITILVVLSVFMFSSYLSYSAIYGDSAQGIRYLVERVALQAQVWWAVDSASEIINPQLSLAWLLRYGFGLGLNEGNVNFGMYFLMQKITPSDVFLRFVDNGIRFTMGAPVNYNYFFGNVLGPIVAIFFGFWAGFGTWLLRNAILMKDLFYGFIVLKYYYFILQICIMSDWYYFLTAKFIVFTIFIAFYSLVLQRIIIKKWASA